MLAGMNTPRGLCSLLLPFALIATATAVTAQDSAAPPCQPCAGIRVADPLAIREALAAAPRLNDPARLYVLWRAPLDGSAKAGAFAALRAAGATPWAVVRLTTPSPVTEHASELEAELREIARLVRGAGDRAHVQLDWSAAGTASAAEMAFVFKRAAVAVTGAEPAARVIVGPLAAEPERLRALYAEDVAAYIDGIALMPAPPARLAAARESLRTLAPGTPIVLDALPWPDDPRQTLSLAAASAARDGVAVTVFGPKPTSEGPLTAADLVPLKLLAREFQGDLSYDSSSSPRGADGAWAFVRGEDLGLRIVARVADGGELAFDDPQLRRPEIFDLASGDSMPAFSQRRTGSGGLAFTIDHGPVALVKLDRATAAELEGVAEEVLVASERQMPVEEILRRLQAFEDNQARRLETYRATNTTHMRFQSGTDSQAFEATFRGAFFFHQDSGFDWAWQEFFINGVRWRSKKVPQIPLIQPQKVATLPLLISFNKTYRYRLRGTEVVRGRDCWVIDFVPLETGSGIDRFRGTVWVDREHYGRVRTRAIQLGLEGDVLSNEETIDLSPIAADGQPGAWTATSFWLPTHTVSHQLLSLLDTTLVAEKETLLTELRLNPADFEAQREAVLASDATMVRDTDAGLRYLVKDKETGERLVQEKLEPTRLFVLGGVFYDQSFDFPIPLAGIDYFSLDWHDTGTQVNLFFAGALLTANIATPSLFGSKWSAGADVFGIAFAGEDQVFRDNREIVGEAVDSRPASLDLVLGHPIGSFGKIDLRYAASYRDFQRADTTAEDFIIPSDHLTQRFGLTGRYNRGGYRIVVGGDFNTRSSWDPWGFAANPDFDPDKKEYLRWRAALGKTWFLPKFRKLSAELEYVDGTDLDRFSKYQFGFFSDVRVHGYQSDRVRAERALASHLSYGVNFGEAFRLELVGDAALATDKLEGLDDELLAGIGLVGTVIGPWNTIVNIDVGVAVAGPDDGASFLIAFLKLFGGK